MQIPPHRIPLRIARGDYTDLQQATMAHELKEGEACYARDTDSLYVVENVGGFLDLIRIGGVAAAAPAPGPTPTAAAAKLTVLHEDPAHPGQLEPEPAPTAEGEQLYNPDAHTIKVAVVDTATTHLPGSPIPLKWEEATPPIPSPLVVQAGPPAAAPTAAGEMVFDKAADVLYVAGEANKQPVDPVTGKPIPGPRPLMWFEVHSGAAGGAPTGGAKITVSDTKGTPQGLGEMLYTPTRGELFISTPAAGGGFAWTSTTGSASGVLVQDLQPAVPTLKDIGNLWFSPAQQQLYIAAESPPNSGTVIWEPASPGAPPGGVFISPTPPTAPIVGNLWFNDATGELFIYYSDQNTSQWVSANAIGGTSSVDSVVYIGSAPPNKAEVGKLWFSDITAELFIYLDDGNSKQWVSTAAVGASQKIDVAPVKISDTPPAGARVGDIWFHSNLGVSYVYYESAPGVRDWVAMQPATTPAQPTRGVTTNVSVAGVDFEITDGVITKVTP